MPVVQADVLPVELTAPTPVADAVVAQDVQACLQGLRTGMRLSDLQNGLAVETRNATLQALAKDGLALSTVPADVQLPVIPTAQADTACSWADAGGRWVLWRPAHLPFELTDGARGEAVRWLQVRLVALNLYVAPVDGMAGWRTLAALNIFQRQHGLSAHSSVDAWTLFLLEHGTAKSAA
jgi:hypothetical protein